MTPVQWADFYHTVFNFQVFFGPAIAICLSYTRIYLLLKRRSSALNGITEERTTAIYDKAEKVTG